MTALLDDQIFALQEHGGVSRYFVELLRRLGVGDPPTLVTAPPVLWSKNQHLNGAGLGRPLRLPLGNRYRVLQLANRLSGRGALADGTVHHTFYDARYLDRYRQARRRVVTVHDMIPEIFPELAIARLPHESKRAHVEAADVLLCVSETTAGDLRRVWPHVRAPIVVTPLAPADVFRPVLERPELPDDYVLFVGQRGNYKDFAVLAEALALLPGRRADLWLVCVGEPLTGGERELLRRLGLIDRTRTTTLSDVHLAGAYSHARCFVFPSRYEGFGLPTLEAMACGCPVVLARTPAHEEVGGSVAAYFPPGDATALARLLGDLLDAPEQRDALAAKGLQRAATYSWERTAALTAAAYAGAP